jgi:hypothetical protein
MLQSLNKLLKARNIRARILTRGVGLTVFPLIAVLAVIWITNGVANSISIDGYSQLANQDLNHIVRSLLSACKLYDGYLSSAVQGAKNLLDRTGSVHFDSSETLTWQAKNQITSQIVPMRLPLMRVGETAIRPVSDFSKLAPIVDEVQALYQLSSTVFQRMNEQGDMLRISTTVKKADGSRAIGTFIPAVAADGTPNPVISKILKGETYLGRAFVVNSWYIAAYQPLKAADGSVTGMIYTGAPEGPVKDKIMQFNNLSDADGSTDVFIVHTAGKEHGLFVQSSDPNLQNHKAWDLRDAHGDLYVQEICKKALANEGSVTESSYWSVPTPSSPSEKILVRFIYFPAWDWVIGVQEPERQFLATPTKIRQIFRVSNYLPLFLVMVSVVITLTIWNRLTHTMTEQVAVVMKTLERSSAQVAKALRAIGGNAESVGEGAEELSRSTQNQAASVEETSATTSLITETAKRNSQTAERMLSLATNADGLVVDAQKTMRDVNGAMESILSTNDEALSIIDTINEISFATNIVALNASVEAARAGEAGRTFVFIAEEVRSLAAKVAAAAKETQQIISNSRDQMHKGTDLCVRLGSAITPLKENADQVRALAGDVTATSASQAEGMEQVLLAMEEMQKSSEQTAHAAVQSTKDSAELRSQVATLAACVRNVDQAVNELNKEFLSDE